MRMACPKQESQRSIQKQQMMTKKPFLILFASVLNSNTGITDTKFTRVQDETTDDS